MSTRIRCLGAACILLATGCGSANQADTPASTEGPPTSESAAPTTTTTAPEVPTYRLLSAEELGGALLGVEDLPPGYSQDPPGNNSSEKTFCDYQPPFDFQTEASRDFTKGGGLSAEALSVGLRQFAGPDEARAAFDALAAALSSCTGETYQGMELTYAPMSAPKVGDASVGVKINADGTDLLQYFALVGPILVNTGGGGLMNASADDVTSLLESQVSSYQAAAAG